MEKKEQETIYEKLTSGEEGKQNILAIWTKRECLRFYLNSD